jgi:hypothetical protein
MLRSLHRHRIAALSSSLVVMAALAGAAARATAQAPAQTVTFENAEFRYRVALPKACQHQEGPGTLEAICSPELDAEKSARASSASALVLSISVEPVAEDIGKSPAELAQRFGETQFTGELPESVCGESERGRVKVENVQQRIEGASVVYTADVLCSEIRFLSLGERRASARTVLGPGLRYRLFARALKDDYERLKSTIDAFFASFQLVSADKKSP